MVVRTPNGRLRALIADAGWTEHAVAEAVNAVGGEAGLALRYDRSSVAHWLAGTRPPPHVRAFVAEALSRRLGRPVSVEETGLDGAPPDVVARRSAEEMRDPVAELVGLADAGRPKGRGLRGMVYSATAEREVPSLAAMAAACAQPAASACGMSAGPVQVESARLMLSVFCDADASFGGGRARRALSGYLAADMVAWLRARARPRIRRELLRLAARLSYLAGYMCFDEQLGGAAQAYCRIAAELSAEAADPGGYATALRGMSVQAHILGHHHEALDLAESAAAACDRVPPDQAAFLAGQAAVAAAAMGRQRDALARLSVAERFLRRADGCEAPIGSYHAAALAHQQAEVFAELGDTKGAVDALTTSLRLRPAGERRARALISARLAELYLRQGQLEQACAIAGHFCDDYLLLRSSRADSALRSLRASLRPYGRNGAARVLLERTAGFSPSGLAHS